MPPAFSHATQILQVPALNRILLPLIFGLAGAAVLVSLGVWQVQRLTWKQGILAQIEARIDAAPVAIPDAPTPDDRFLAVQATGQLAEPTLRVLVSTRDQGAGYRLITALDTGSRRIMVDRGYIKNDVPTPPAPQGEITVTGNLHWPDERDSYTPENDRAANIWFARDLAPMAKALGTEQVLLVARSLPEDTAVTPLPVGTEGIPNDHLGYAIQWFGLAAVWTAMLGLYIWRQRKPAKGTDL